MFYTLYSQCCFLAFPALFAVVLEIEIINDMYFISELLLHVPVLLLNNYICPHLPFTQLLANFIRYSVISCNQQDATLGLNSLHHFTSHTKFTFNINLQVIQNCKGG